MLKDEGQPWSYVVGGKRIGDNLEKAIERGAVRRREDGRFELAGPEAGGERTVDLTPHIVHKAGKLVWSCRFLNSFLFRHIYAEAAVPFGCRSCYKVKVVSRSLRQLMAVKTIAETLDFTSKSGPELTNPDNPHPYGSYFYLDGLEQARALYRQLRTRLDEDPLLGPETEMFIKRGCTNYEIKCGPSDRYQFDPALEEVEAVLKDLFVKPRPPLEAPVLNALRILQMVHTAYQIGDETYRDFTDGRSLAPAIVRYPPEDAEV